MAKFAGLIGYAISTDQGDGIYKEKLVERKARGDLLRAFRNVQEGETIHDGVTLSHRISIVADPFTNNNLDSMRYLVYMGIKWKITSIEVIRPRIMLTVGGVYNG